MSYPYNKIKELLLEALSGASRAYRKHTRNYYKLAKNIKARMKDPELMNNAADNIFKTKNVIPQTEKRRNFRGSSYKYFSHETKRNSKRQK